MEYFKIMNLMFPFCSSGRCWQLIKFRSVRSLKFVNLRTMAFIRPIRLMEPSAENLKFYVHTAHWLHGEPNEIHSDLLAWKDEALSLRSDQHWCLKWTMLYFTLQDLRKTSWGFRLQPSSNNARIRLIWIFAVDSCFVVCKRTSNSNVSHLLM